jgi:hypothetical protein
MASLVTPFSGIGFLHFTHLVTTDPDEPFDDPECRRYLPELHTVESPNRSCWGREESIPRDSEANVTAR